MNGYSKWLHHIKYVLECEVLLLLFKVNLQEPEVAQFFKKKINSASISNLIKNYIDLVCQKKNNFNSAEIFFPGLSLVLIRVQVPANY